MEVARLPYKFLLPIVDVPIQYMFRYTNSDERCKRLAEEETISFSSLVTAAAFLRTAHVKEYQLGGRLAKGDEFCLEVLAGFLVVTYFCDAKKKNWVSLKKFP